MEEITPKRFDEASEEIYREISDAQPGADVVAQYVAYAAMLRRKLFGPREKVAK